MMPHSLVGCMIYSKISYWWYCLKNSPSINIIFVWSSCSCYYPRHIPNRNRVFSFVPVNLRKLLVGKHTFLLLHRFCYFEILFWWLVFVCPLVWIQQLVIKVVENLQKLTKLAGSIEQLFSQSPRMKPNDAADCSNWTIKQTNQIRFLLLAVVRCDGKTYLLVIFVQFILNKYRWKKANGGLKIF